MSLTLSALAKQRFADLQSSSANPRVVEELGRIMTEGSELDGYKINAYRIADALGVPRSDAVRSLLFAAQLGLLDLNWDVHCPSCKGVPEFARHLMQLKERAHCAL